MNNPDLKIEGKIHSVQSCGTVDGPGIRYVLFMQGCPLRCKYCHNPDTWDQSGGKPVTVEEIVNEVLDLKPYFTFSNGGITVSGGEPLMQPEFLMTLFKRLRSDGVHTALDTSGYCDITDKIKELLLYTNLVLLDIKQTDETIHKKLTSKSFDRTMRFLDYLSEKNIPVWLRIVLIEGWTDSDDNINSVIQIAKTHKNVELVELLPYHSAGVHKWDKLGYKYSFGSEKAPSKERMDQIVKMFKANDISISYQIFD